MKKSIRVALALVVLFMATASVASQFDGGDPPPCFPGEALVLVRTEGRGTAGRTSHHHTERRAHPDLALHLDLPAHEVRERPRDPSIG